MAGHYASPNVGRLLAQANLILMPTSALVLRDPCQRAGAAPVDRPPTDVPLQRLENLVLHAKSFNSIEAARTGG
jgi:hypothetical protein